MLIQANRGPVVTSCKQAKEDTKNTNKKINEEDGIRDAQESRGLGGPGSRVSLIRVLEGWLDPSSAVRPVEDVVPPDQTPEEIAANNQAAMITSQEQATVAALEELGY